MQHPTKIKTPATTIKEVKIEVIQPFHLSNQFSIKSVKGPFIAEFSASSLDRDVNPCRVLVIIPSGAVLFGIYINMKLQSLCKLLPFWATSCLMLACSPKPSG
jgi:hypothetical protein